MFPNETLGDLKSGSSSPVRFQFFFFRRVVHIGFKIPPVFCLMRSESLNAQSWSSQNSTKIASST